MRRTDVRLSASVGSRSKLRRLSGATTKTKEPRAATPVVALIALAVVGWGVSTIVNTRNHQTETLAARLSPNANLAYSHADFVEFHFADGSDDDVRSDDSEGLFDAVDKFGPGTARVTRTTDGHSIRTVVFHGKTYDISSPSLDRLGGIIAVVLGGLVFGLIMLNRYLPDPDAGAAAKSGAKSGA